MDMIDERGTFWVQNSEWTDERKGQEEDANQLEWCNIDADFLQKIAATLEPLRVYYTLNVKMPQ